MSDFLRAEIDDEGSIHMQVGGRSVVLNLQEYLPLAVPPRRPNPTKWPPVVTYVIGPGGAVEPTGELVEFDITDWMIVETDNAERLAELIAALPWTGAGRLRLTVESTAALTRLDESLRWRMGEAAPTVEARPIAEGDAVPQVDI